MIIDKLKSQEIDWQSIDKELLEKYLPKLIKLIEDKTTFGEIQWYHKDNGDENYHVAQHLALTPHSFNSTTTTFYVYTKPDLFVMENNSIGYFIEFPVGYDSEPIKQKDFDGMYNAIIDNEHKYKNGIFKEMIDNAIISMGGKL